MKKTILITIEVLAVLGFLGLNLVYPLEEAMSSQETEFVEEYATYIHGE